MLITLHKITVEELAANYSDNNEGGVTGFGGKLDIRPPYQREFVYKDKQRDAVIRTVMQGFPLNVMYWSDREDGHYEVIDGQQRTISICQYVEGDFSIDGLYFHSLPSDKREQILKYELQIYFCKGTESERLEWFKTINIAGEKLTDQELRNAVYAGPWVSDAKRYFSKNGCAAYGLAKDYISGSPIRQEFLEIAIDWLSKGKIEEHMSAHQHDPNANELWRYFRGVIDWIKATFPVVRSKEMRKVDWGPLFDEFEKAKLDQNKLEEQVKKLMADSDVQNKAGIYPYVLNGKENLLSIRMFDDNIKRSVYEKQQGICKICGKPFKIEEMEADHITPWSQGGHTTEDNCQMLCRECNRRKSDR